MKGVFVDFRLLKECVLMEAVLAHYGIRLRGVGKISLRGPCPLPTHTSERSKESFNVNTVKNVWTCYSASCVCARGGKVGGDVLDFVALMDECSVREAAIRLQARFPISAVSLRGSTAAWEHTKGNLPSAGTAEREDIRANKPLTFTLTGIDPTHPYLRNRGISAGTAQHFGTGFFPGRGSMAGRIVIPIHDEGSRLVAYAGRSVDGAKPRYRLPAGFMKSAILFNLHRVSSDEVVVVEGFFDCLNVWQAGHQNVIALMGCSLSAQQERLLSRFKRIILLLDGDDAGVQATRVIADRLVRCRFVRAVEIAVGRQPDELSSEEIRAFLRF